MHVLQIEINRALYMDERRVTPNGSFEAFRAALESVIAEIASIGRPAEMPMAAE